VRVLRQSFDIRAERTTRDPLLLGAPSDDAVDDFLEALPAPVEPATRDIARQAAELQLMSRPGAP